MYLTALTHRDELFDLTVRWLNDDFHSDDGRIITRIFLYESVISAAVEEEELVRVPARLGEEAGVTIVET
jgi:hypothetical protein